MIDALEKFVKSSFSGTLENHLGCIDFAPKRCEQFPSWLKLQHKKKKLQ